MTSPGPTEAQIRTRLYTSAGTVVLCSADLLRPFIRTTEHHELIHLPSQEVTLREREALKPLLLAEEDYATIRSLLIQSRGFVRHRGNDQCQRCLLGQGPFADCISLPGTEGGACGNCAFYEYNTQCIYHKAYHPGGTPLHARPLPAAPRVGGERSLRSLPPYRYFDVDGWVNGRPSRSSGDGVMPPSVEEQEPRQPALPSTKQALLIEYADKPMESDKESGADGTDVMDTEFKLIPLTEEERASLYNATPRSTPSVETTAAGSTTHLVDTPLADTTISTYKQTHTTLRVSVSGKPRFVAVKLRSCVTMSTFFSSVLAAWGLEEQKEKIDDVTARFGWLPEEDAMVIKENIQDSFAELLETIDAAPCWRLGVEGAKCYVNIEVFLKGA